MPTWLTVYIKPYIVVIYDYIPIIGTARRENMADDEKVLRILLAEEQDPDGLTR